LWFLHELAPDSAAYVIASALRLDGPLDPEALERALRALVGRHASLRARIVRGEEGPAQRFDVPFESIHARGAPLPGDATAAAAILSGEAYRPFDLEAGPLFRTTLHPAPGGWVLLASAHHAVADLWSLSVVMRDLRGLYAAAAGGAPFDAEPAPHPAGAVLREQGWLQGEDAARQLAFWRERLSGPPPAIELPADHPRPASQSFRGATRLFPLSADLAAAARRLARERGMTLHTLLLAAFQVFLHRVTGQTDLIIGLPASRRASPWAARLVAYTVNAVPARSILSGDTTFEEWLARSGEETRRSLANQDYPFERLVRLLAPARDPSRSPLFDVMFDLHAGGAGKDPIPFGPGVTASPVPLDGPSSQFDLSLTIRDEGAGLSAEIEHSADLFEPETIEGLAGSFFTLLRAAVAAPATPLSRLPLLPPEKRSAILASCSARRAARGPAMVHRLFERWAAARPEAPAVLHGEASITYGDLERRSAALALRLVEAGIGPERPAAVCLSKSIDLVVAFLAVMRAGGPYVPIDPSLPPARRRWMAADAGAALALAAAGEAAVLGVPVLNVAAPRPAGRRAGRLSGREFPDSLAYIIYTSGTTGTPKGVGVTHGALAGAFAAWDERYGLAPFRRHLQMAAPGFDVFTGDLVRALGSGAALVLCDRDTLLDPGALAALARRHEVDFAEFVPATLRGLAAWLIARGERLSHPRLAVVGSDAWSAADLASFRRAFAEGVVILNSYGVTEATIDSTCGDPGAPDGGRVPAIGRPLSNTSAYVLDSWLEPVPPLVRGELYLGGPAVARGYHGRPGLTAERFVPDPHGPPGSRLYRTGDAARLLPDGTIAFAGRRDGQVKIRGVRVEPAEIEAALAAHPAVRACAVAARDGEAGLRLAAWVAAAEGSGVTPAALRAHLAERLPEAMVPSAIVLLDALPLSANGKVDRKALPEPAWGTPEEGDVREEPATPAEAALADVWRHVLRVPRPGRRDHFFRLGGDSILTIQVVSRAREAGLSITPRMVFENPTLEALARAAGGRPAGSPDTASFTGEAALLPMQRWFFEQRFHHPSHWNMAIALDAGEELDPAAARRASAALLQRHDSLRARFRPGPDGWIQDVLAPGDEPALECCEAGREEEHEAAVESCARRLHAGLDIERGPLVRFGAVQAPDRSRWTLLIVAHHLAVDGVSLRILAEDFERAYAAARAGGPVALPA
ncbi:MAG TPA: amino acid adenylation domain-containing protein, partial [Candidatus Polarisedimenticolia bacterium]|nr:amino acid adenylation domain-containing protein [Candidatus Polarisedimenticolia bacterium]